VAFAQANEGGCLVDGSVGEPLWAFISGPEVRLLYEALLARVRKANTAVDFTYRCDSPDRRRLFELVAVPLSDGHVAFASLMIRDEPRPRVALLQADVRRGTDLVRMCSWCKKILTEDGWVEIEDAVAKLGLLERENPPSITHGVCDACHADLMEKVEEGTARARR
jgi:hypothetical protein